MGSSEAGVPCGDHGPQTETKALVGLLLEEKSFQRPLPELVREAPFGQLVSWGHSLRAAGTWAALKVAHQWEDVGGDERQGTAVKARQGDV